MVKKKKIVLYADRIFRFESSDADERSARILGISKKKKRKKKNANNHRR